jgi:hypothetical protein
MFSALNSIAFAVSAQHQDPDDVQRCRYRRVKPELLSSYIELCMRHHAPEKTDGSFELESTD